MSARVPCELVEFRVLGPLEVADATTSTQLRGRKERAVLAVLVLAAGEVMGTDRLIDALWGERPPRSAAKNVQNCVLRLRKSLGPEAIETRAPGYRLAAPVDAIDARRFEDLVTLGRAARVNGTPDRAAGMFREALGLWRGPPFDELRGWDPADVEAARLAELQRAAAEELMDAELACGHHAACVTGLERMAAEEPFRERRWAMLMLALYRCGRQADALRTYQRARSVLATDLGIEPGPELRALERAVVAQDGSLDLAGQLPGSSTIGAPPVGEARVVFVLFSDVVASTELLDRLGDEAAEDRRRAHVRLLRDAVAAHGGREVKNLGDGLMVAFASGVDAVACALEMRRAVEESRRTMPDAPNIRIGLHVGEPMRDEDDYFGTSVVIAQRLCDAAAPGQIVASDLVRELVGPRRRFAFADAGSTALKGLAEPIPVVEILGESTEVEAEPSTPAEPPYKGLVAFEPEDSALFFGREATVATLIDRLASARLLAVVGASGSGKSSLVRAGVVAALRRDALPGSSTWPTLLMSPGAHPLAELAAHLSLRAGVPAGSLLDDLADEPRTLDLAARQAAASLPAGARVVVVIDQFEELFTLCRDECERGQFIDALVHAVTMDGGITTVVLAVRADFYGHCAAHAELARLLETGTALLGPMAGTEMAAAIDGPARVSGFRLEPGLPAVILRDLADEPGALPLLSHALLETWKRRRGRMLTHRGYDDAGGVRSAIARTAESVYGQLDSTQQSLARNVFVRLTELGEGTADTRRRVAVVELSAGPDESERLASVLHTLAEARLVTLDEADVELAHEAIIGEWPRLRGWLDDDREGLRIHRHITHAAQDWEVLGRDAAELYRGPRLAAALEWADRTGDRDLNPLEHEFLAAGRARQQQETREQAAQVRRLRRLLAGVGIALVAALVAGTLALVEQRRADDHADAARDATLRADVGRLVAESDNLSDRDRYLAALLALEAHRVADTAATRSAVLNAVLAEPRLQATMSAGHGGYTAVSYVPPGRLVAARSADMLDFFDTRTGRPSGAPIELEPGGGFAVNPDGSLVATGSRDGTVTLWDVETRTRTDPPLTLGHNALGLTFSPDGERLVTLEGEYADTSPMATASSVHVWDVASREPVDLQLGGHTAAVNTAAFSPDGRILATGGNDARVVLHDAATGVALGPPLSFGSYVFSLSFSPDGTRLAVGTQQGESLIFDVATGAQLASLPGEGIVSKVAFSPDGRRIATFLNDAQVFDGTTFEPIGAPMDTHGGYSNGAFSPDGRTLAIAAFAGIVGLWDPDGQPRIAKPIPGSSPFGGTFSPDGKLIAVPEVGRVTLYSAATLAPVGPPLPVPAGPPTHGFPPIASVAYSPDGRIVAVGGGVPTVQRYQVATLEPVGDPIRLDAPASDLAFSPDGDLLAIGSVLDTITLVDTEQGTQSPAHPLGRSTFTSVTFSPDGRRLVATSIGEGGAWVFDLTKEDPTPKPFPDTLDDVAVAAFSPDGGLAATGSVAGTVQFRDPRTFAALGAAVTVAEGVVVNLAFSPDGGLLAAGDIKSLAVSTTRLVDVATRQTVGEPQAGLPAVSPSFSPDGTTMATSSLSNTLLWSLDPVIWRERLCEIAGRSLTDAEVREYLPNNPDAPPTCGQFPRAGAR
jgi:WD40 repeat protein/DNA-binding SARP family transcriptional activator